MKDLLNIDQHLRFASHHSDLVKFFIVKSKEQITVWTGIDFIFSVTECDVVIPVIAIDQEPVEKIKKILLGESNEKVIEHKVKTVTATADAYITVAAVSENIKMGLSVHWLSYLWHKEIWTLLNRQSPEQVILYTLMRVDRNCDVGR